MTITSIHNSSALEPFSHLTEGEEGFLILDFDQTCVKPTRELVDELFFTQLEAMKSFAGIEKGIQYPHEQWFLNALKNRYVLNTPHKPNDSNIKRIIKLFKDKGWQVRILTNRHQFYAQDTYKHIRQADLNIDPDECNFREDDSLRKGSRLLELIPKRPVNVIFVDDHSSCCEEVVAALREWPEIKGRVFLYDALPLSQQKLKRWFDRLSVQLYHHKQGTLEGRISYSPDTIKKAKEHLKLCKDYSSREAFIHSFVNACIEIAEKDGYPFALQIPEQAPSKRAKTASK